MSSESKMGKRRPYLGVLEITGSHIRLFPAPFSRQERQQILWDFIAQEVPGHPWHVVGMPLHPTPCLMLDALLPKVLDNLGWGQNEYSEEACAPPASAQAQSSCTGVTYTIGIKPVPDSPYHFRVCNIRLLAVRRGETWQDSEGRPLILRQRDAAAQSVLAALQQGRQSN